jgi:hypothetical protein
MNVCRLLAVACLAASFAAARPAAAQCNGCAATVAGNYGNYGGYGGWGGWGGGYWDIGRLYSVLSQNVPYYAAFPPVYYSVPVARTYGYSPFAYPPGVMTPDVVAAIEPQEIVNPYIEDVETPEKPKSADSAPAAPADRTTSTPAQPKPLVVVNPYVTNSAYAQR